MATADSSRNDSVADLPQVSSPRFSLLALDVGLFALITFFPWIGLYYTQQGGALSLPSLAIEAAKLASQVGQYSSLANQLGGDHVYQLAMGTLVFVAVVAAIGWVLVVKNLCADVQADYSGRNVVGKGAMSVAILAAVVQLAAWVGVASVQSMLKNQYYDLSVLGTGILQTTLWVWVSLGCGIAAHYYRKKVLSGV